ncbi:diacylglycerol kinase family protein [Knoellia koreensis]|uniref:Diacylglycerol kinase family lipid kinase n=1 Tax=Knoellia koreensis TaxID=2730921 RepID=A0A849HHG1_9MICO|nr:diacylglycerol kinase family lipid kinase [Knoellia sp. DB2414S]
MLSDHPGWIAIGAIVLVIAFAALIASLSARPRRRGRGAHRASRWSRRPHRNEFRPEGTVTETPKRRVAIIVNPTKFDDLEGTKAHITRQVVQHGWESPLFIETTEKDPGTGQAKEALEQDVDLVCPLGGDGTVRSVAAALVGTDTPLGLLPGGTGNLLARNLDLPFADLDDALDVALTGQNKRIDVGRLTVNSSGEDQRPEQHIFLVMAGFGFDAAIMADAPEGLKAKVGPLAYMVSGTRNLRGPQFKVRVKIDDSEEFTRRTRTVVIGNVGKLVGGLVLLPDAEVDDGHLDAVLLSPKGIVGWAAVAARIASKQRKGHQRVDHHTAREISVRADRPEEAQVDGDTIGKARAISAEVLPGSLVVRVGATA